ncbi:MULTISPECIES: bifunctional metallophosphatase/5'-nucleotidase [unclassified Shewanella]|uniref:bifunctional metallophosphatase/5'-nucleotidase n=1 Tax=unclassified Shewanella TaxID=196818 RepID=UPI000C8343F8|nr:MULTISPECIES: bifunctional metallophosphatase/5'-nucleotidase [unclassified Shewanella]MDO6619906.1 bifunctional metallophosphatase/5'-nucleotidase [Shewanella sp. 6_MG-2023]MDO6641057.1 bifunctional metallophosphatase/5'-nucleotidase [Shewanella sp. 5_MG-2023]MDO6776339.1 bifunctional metallophosphatase/5'-nucleotidase [Shewanella sp. 3_MG-2023]PMG27057.1 bifunctional metallophosphatase/5'-nucleotidase [Shewanella sp. 10N.286.52.C2]PMH84423.1 bifunctional metallophosphatase/5'-nucleotidase
MPNNYRLSLAHINDTHSNFEPSSVQFSLSVEQQHYHVNTKTGGYARLGHQIESARQQAAQHNHEFLFLHGGDSFQGTLYFREFQGAANAHLLNMLKPDAMVLGNHEIDAGNSPVLAFLNRIEFPVLAGNMDLSQELTDKEGRLSGHPMLYDYDNQTQCAKVLVKPFYDTHIAIVGITLDQMPLIARPDPDTHFINAIDTTANTIASLQQQGIQHIIVLSHLGLDQDRELAEKVSGISVIVGGHSHTLQGQFDELGLSHTPYAERVNNTPIIHASKYAEVLGLANITFDRSGACIAINGNNYFMIDDELEVLFNPKQDNQLTNLNTLPTEQQINSVKTKLISHPAIRGDQACESIHNTIMEQYRPALNALEEQVLAYIPHDFIHTRLPSKHFPHGSEIAPWVCRSMFKATKHSGEKLDFALHNAGGVRQSLNKGSLSMADVLGRILPFELPLVKYQIQGKYLYEVLESAINAATNNGVTGTGAGSFPYTYGIRYFYDGTLAMHQRITSVELYQDGLWSAIDPEKLYIGVSSAYTALGKEGYDALLKAHWQQDLDTMTLPEAFVDFVTQHGNLIENPLQPNVYYISHR